jgi:hypothetical protein
MGYYPEDYRVRVGTWAARLHGLQGQHGVLHKEMDE